MKKIPLICSTILLSTFANAGDAPVGIETDGLSLNIGGQVVLEGISINGKCLDEADPADVRAGGDADGRGGPAPPPAQVRAQLPDRREAAAPLLARPLGVRDPFARPAFLWQPRDGHGP